MSAKATDGSGKATKAEDSVLGSLPSTRPNRIGGRARDGGSSAAGTRPAKGAKPKTAAAKATAAKSRTAKTAKAAVAKPAPAPKAATGPRPTAPAKPGPTSKSTPIAAVPDAPKAAPRPKAVRAGARNLKAPSQAQRPDTKAPQPSGTQIVGTVVQAAGELAQIGATVAGQVAKRFLDKLPKP